MHGEKLFSELAPQMAEKLGFSPQTMLSLLWVARRFPKGSRRPSLSQTHHALVATLGDFDREFFLDECVDKNWSATQLRRAIAKKKRSKRVLDGKTAAG
jgi:hypothetical protein